MRKFLVWLKGLNRTQVALHGGLFIALFLIFLYLTFPYDIIRDVIAQKLEAQGKVQVAIGSIKPFRLFGVRIKDLRIADIDDATKVFLNVDETRVRVRPTQLFLGRVWLDFDVYAYGGGLAGSYCRHGSANDVAINFVDFGLRNALREFTRQVGQLDVDGTLGGDFNAHFSAGAKKGNSGALHLSLDKLRVANINLAGQQLPNLKFEPGKLAMELQQNIFKLSDFTLKGDNLSLKASGQVYINETSPSKSRLTLTFKFKPSEEFESGLGLLAMGLPAADADGYYETHVSETFDSLGAKRGGGLP
jgi:type II secretion system protein N